MIKDILTYPDERIKTTSADVRVFDEELFGLLENMKDTMLAKGADALAAIQIAVPAAVIVVRRDDGRFLELVNPRIIAFEGTVPSTEKTLYFDGIEATLPRYGTIKLVYQDRSGTQKSMDVGGELSIRIQRKIDYTFGGTFVDKLGKQEQKRVQKEAEAKRRQRISEGRGFGVGIKKEKPKRFYRDRFMWAIKTLFPVKFLILLTPLTTDAVDVLQRMYRYDTAVALLLAAVITGYFVTAHYETKRERSCTGCQSGNIIANTVVFAIMTVILSFAGYFFLNPS